MAALATAATAQPPLTIESAVTGLDRPLYVTGAPGDEDRLYVVEQWSGNVQVAYRGQLRPTPFLSILPKVAVDHSERGMLGLAFHPNYESNGYFYVSYTRAGDGASIVERYTRIDADNADPSSGVVILGPVTQPTKAHNGGCIQFGPNDGYLYFSLGDGGGNNDPLCSAQNPLEMRGKILRVDVDGGSPYAIPASNPFVGAGTHLEEIWSLGWRNPWRFSFDPVTGAMYVGDVGEKDREEVSFDEMTTGGGNYGWKVLEGTFCTGSPSCGAIPHPSCTDPSLIAPIWEFDQSNGECSVIGGYVYRGCGLPGLEGKYFFADWCSRRVWSMRYDGQTVSEMQEHTTEFTPTTGFPGRIASFGTDTKGELYICNLTRGEIFRIVAAGPPQSTNLGFASAPAGVPVPFFEMCGLLGAGQSATLILRETNPSRSAALLLSTNSNPTSVPFGTIVPVPLLAGIAGDDERGRPHRAAAGRRPRPGDDRRAVGRARRTDRAVERTADRLPVGRRSATTGAW